jgi:ADP-ribosylglycohydrolase
MKNRNDNMLLRIAQADAFALPYEYVNDTHNPGLKEQMLMFDRYLKNPRQDNMLPGMYSDDTQQSIAVAEVLIDKKDRAWPEDFSDAWFNCFHRDPRDGYSRIMQNLLETAKSPDHLRQLIKPISNKNGAAMRSVPIGVIADPEDVARIAYMQASTTHSETGILASIAVALMSHFALYTDRPFNEFLEWGYPYCQVIQLFSRPWVGRVKDTAHFGSGINTAWAVHTLLVDGTSLDDIMRRVIGWGGDTDSTASIAWGITSARFHDELLPEFLERDLDSGREYGPTFLKELGRRLMDAYAC